MAKVSISLDAELVVEVLITAATNTMTGRMTARNARDAPVIRAISLSAIAYSFSVAVITAQAMRRPASPPGWVV